MADLEAAITAAADGDDSQLLAAVRDLPARPGPPPDPRGDEDGGPIPGQSFDDVTAAWCAGQLDDATYFAALDAASAPGAAGAGG